MINNGIYKNIYKRSKNVLDFLSGKVILLTSTPNNGDKMEIGSVVENPFGDIGIVIQQIGVVDRWVVQWATGEKYPLNGCNLFLVTL